MLKRTVSGIMVAFLLIGMLTLAFNIQPVKASGTIYIRADGSIDPPTAPIQRSGDVYTLTDNITSDTTAIVVERSNMMLDGAGYTVEGTNATMSEGIFLSGRSNVTIKKTSIRSFWFGIYLNYSSYTIIQKNSIANMVYGAIYLEGSSKNNFSGNEVKGWLYGVRLWECSNNTLAGNTITNSDIGIELVSSSKYNHIVGNRITDNDGGVRIESHSGYYTEYNNIVGNNITGNTDYGILLDDSKYNNIVGNEITNNGIGVYLGATRNSISGNKITNNECGIKAYLSGSANVNSIYHNDFVNNTNQVNSLIAWNVWDDGYPYGGNYWSDYGGEDADGDGIGDTPYVIDVDNQDNYPLMNPYVLGDLDRDSDVDEDDLWHFAETFIDYYKIHVKDPLSDFDKDCDIDEDDLWAMAEAFIDYWKQH